MGQSKLNILILSWRGPGHPHAGGAEIVTHEHAKAWIRAGHKVTLFTSFYPGAKKREVIDGIEIIRQGKEILGIQVNAFFWYIFGSHEKFDLVIDQFHGLPFFTPLFVGVKKIAFIHEVAKEVWKLNPWPKPFNLIPAFFGSILEPWIFRLIYKKIPFMTVSDSTRADLETWGVPSKNITVIHNGVIIFPFDLIPKKEKIKTAMFLGALASDKGIREAIYTFAEMDKSGEKWQFWIAGKGNDKYMKKIYSLVKELGIEKRTKFWGWVDEKKKFELLAKAHVLINTSAREGWGLVNIEANAMGTPVLAFDVAGVRDSVKDNETGFLVTFGDYRSLALNALKLMNDQRLYKKVQKDAILWSNNFKWEKAATKSLEYIKKITKEQ